MKPPTSILAVLICLSGVQAVDYFFKFVGGNPAINGQRLRFNSTSSPGASEAPYNPDDHFSRIHLNETGAGGTQLIIVPTNPHPPPVPGYYALNGDDGVDAAYRTVQTYRPDDDGDVNLYDGWNVLQTDAGRRVLRYEQDAWSGSRWIAVEETTEQGVKRWVPWWVKATEENMVDLTAWEYDIVDVELVEAKGPVDSEAPGGIDEEFT